jgi:hypothetical protein
MSFDSSALIPSVERGLSSISGFGGNEDSWPLTRQIEKYSNTMKAKNFCLILTIITQF